MRRYNRYTHVTGCLLYVNLAVHRGLEVTLSNIKHISMDNSKYNYLGIHFYQGAKLPVLPLLCSYWTALCKKRNLNVCFMK